LLFGLTGCLKNMIVCIHKDVHIREYKFLVDQLIDFFASRFAHFATINLSQIFWFRVLRVFGLSGIGFKKGSKYILYNPSF